MSIQATLYAENELQYLPQHYDDQTKKLIRFMLMEAYNAGFSTGYKLGEGTGKGFAIERLYDLINALQDDDMDKCEKTGGEAAPTPIF